MCLEAQALNKHGMINMQFITNAATKTSKLNVALLHMTVFKFCVLTDQTYDKLFLPAMRMRLTWKHVHFPPRWSPVDKNAEFAFLIQITLNKEQLLQNTWLKEKNLAVPYLGPTVTDWTTAA